MFKKVLICVSTSTKSTSNVINIRMKCFFKLWNDPALALNYYVCRLYTTVLKWGTSKRTLLPFEKNINKTCDVLDIEFFYFSRKQVYCISSWLHIMLIEIAFIKIVWSMNFIGSYCNAEWVLFEECAFSDI